MTNRFSDCTSLLKDHKVLEILSEFSPEFVGSIPIGVDLPHSDIDIICELRHSILKVLESFSSYPSFQISEKVLGNIPSIICRFRLGSEKVEIVAQSLSPKKQIAYQHMAIEEKILNEKGETFRLSVLEKKKEGKNTEEAFAELLGLKGDPYSSLLEYGERE
ncbi:DUF4269 domain-containing protein [Leptospira selangorensis]|uniref:DUF4269 domain-containing protein n=1 Tax=Leptospira selangorensis TaxID=2484982 RepID=A0A5F2C2R8_9LEPT|nr:DUF4269 domain-containing protein [Leptospira selangorensis]TGM13486.1 DUF4269 domain-containing protein [Leptospira selangorensis]TGM22173.1 DUF4269 domain-containing protein [Leptospira selangorensis]